MLDIRLLLPPKSSDSMAPAHLLVIDLQNRGNEVCSLVDFVVHLPIEDGYTYRFGGGPDQSVAAKSFKAANSRLAPGDEIHQIIAWSSIPQTQNHLEYDDCLSSDGLTAILGRNEPILDVRHLWVEQCGQAWISSTRTGPFVPGEEISAEWLARYGLQRTDVAEPPASVEPERLRSFDSVEYLKSTFESGYSGWFVLGLDRPAGAVGDCAFRTLRRREADGQTTIILNHCARAETGSADGSKRLFEVMLRDYNMLPQRVGNVEYETATELAQGGKPVTAVGIAKVEIRDPTDPMLPAIETTLKPCRADQLTLQATAKLGTQIDIRRLEPMADVPRAGRAYTFTNSSHETCLIGGTPELQVPVQPESSGSRVDIGACRDCSDALFAARNQHWIILRPTDSAHFIVTAKPAYGIDNKPCAYWPKLLIVNGGSTTQLDYELPSCGLIDVSAWRDSAYDNDPLNLHYEIAKASPLKPPTLPEACARAVTTESGRPFMFPSNGPIQYGLSSRPGTFRDGAPVAIWISNPTEHEVVLMTCQDIEGFFLGGFDVLDQSGNRVLTKQEVKAGHPVMRGLMACTMNMPVKMPPHSCGHGTPDKASYFKLGSIYTLPAGHYEVVPRPQEGEQRPVTTGLPIEVTP